ncbi:MAG: hypothetical protein GX230_05565 [Lentisphaerae bacterium]|nr:hypothetical protein [Lentisphaerota bacterium]
MDNVKDNTPPQTPPTTHKGFNPDLLVKLPLSRATEKGDKATSTPALDLIATAKKPTDIPATDKNITVLPPTEPTATKKPELKLVTIEPTGRATTRPSTKVKLNDLISPQAPSPDSPASALPDSSTPQPGYFQQQQPIYSSRRRSFKLRYLWLFVPLFAATAAYFLYKWERPERPSLQLTASTNPDMGENLLPAQEKNTHLPSTSWTRGALRLHLTTYDAEGLEMPLTNTFTISLNSTQPPYSLVTNATTPLLIPDLTVGDYALSIMGKNFYASKTQYIKITPRQLSNATIMMKPFTGEIELACHGTSRTFAVYIGERYLGTSKNCYELPLYVPHKLTLKAPGWRDAEVELTLCDNQSRHIVEIPVQRIKTGMSISVDPVTGPAPTSGLLRINDSTPQVRINLPLQRDSLTYSGEITLNLTIDGFKVIDNDKTITLVDGQTTSVVFRVAPTK